MKRAVSKRFSYSEVLFSTGTTKPDEGPCKFDVFHPFSTIKAKGLVEVLRVFSEGVNIVEVLFMEDLWVFSTDIGRLFYGPIRVEKDRREQF